MRSASATVAAPGATRPSSRRLAGRVGAGALAGEELGEPRHRRGELGRRQAQAGGHPVAAAALDQPLAGQPGDGGAEVDARDRAARALALAGIEPDHHGGAAEALLQPRRDDADDARMPALAGGPGQRAVGAAGEHLRLGRGEHPRLDVAALGVQPVEPLGERRRLVRVVGGEQPRPEVGGADPAAGVDPRPEREAERPGRGRAAHPRHLRERDEARTAAAGHHRQPLAH